ncbi:TRAP transporter substrate-binding protein DctP [Roseomonas sp. HJA6]|uniref:TRAP transporter substrate-binding protein DctP n=1 Tax=Roseomonas alba TaxID=2846776 RepID=A0ABS7A1R2_9PROT|nr:TRAP transporter substrate-binding protein DctP [Neoroseomonas alba]MBW6396234.1 TRAP transporter substrate-binding protein DctP [Neoroseomonas alba]
MTLPRRLILAAPALALGSAHAQTPGWTAASEYPATSIPGEGVTFFAEAATRRGVPVTAAPGAPDGYRSAAAFTALAQGRFAVVDAFSGSLNAVDPMFLLSSLPFLTASYADAARLRDLARPHYAAAAEKQGAALLWTTPWPPSGLWTKRPVTKPEDLQGLRVRTYDATGTAVLRAAGANAEVLSFAEVEARLESGALDAVLSSGDGGAGRRLWRWLPNFTIADYAWPISLAFASKTALAALPATGREAITAAAAETETRQWQAIEGRLAANQRTMRENNVAIHEPTDALRAALRQAAAGATTAWEAQAGDAGRAILAAYRR